MILFNNNEYKSFKELQEKCHLVSEYYIRLHCHCSKSITEKIIKENNLKVYTVNANGKECIVYPYVIIELINKYRLSINETVPDNYIARSELAKYLGVSLYTLGEIEFWSFAFSDHKKTFYIKGVKRDYYEFTPEAKEFYAKKLHKWKHPDRTKCTCY